MAVAVLLLARSPDAEPARPGLAATLGRERYVTLQRMLLIRAAAWGASVAGRGALFVAVEPDGASGSLRAVVGEVVEDAVVFQAEGEGTSARLRAAVERVLTAADERPVLVAWPELCRWRSEHAEGAMSDLQAGCDVAVGPMFDGGFYLLALARPIPALFSLPDEAWHSPQAMGLALAAAHEAGLQAGLLRAERGLRTQADVRAAVADPLTDDELVRVLR